MVNVSGTRSGGYVAPTTSNNTQAVKGTNNASVAVGEPYQMGYRAYNTDDGFEVAYETLKGYLMAGALYGGLKLGSQATVTIGELKGLKRVIVATGTLVQGSNGWVVSMKADIVE